MWAEQLKNRTVLYEQLFWCKGCIQIESKLFKTGLKKSNGNVYYEHYFEEYTATGQHGPKVFGVSHSFSYI